MPTKRELHLNRLNHSTRFATSRGTANKRAAEKRILDSIIGQGKYDSRIRPSGVNNTLEKGGYQIATFDFDLGHSFKISVRYSN